MNKVSVKVSVDTAIPWYWVAIDDQDVIDSPQKTGTINLEVAKEHFLGWWFAGNPGSPYKITLAAPDGYKIVAMGTHPIERKIALNRFQSASAMRFFVVPA